MQSDYVPGPEGGHSARDRSVDEPVREDSAQPVDDDAIRSMVTRLSRPHGSGGDVIERAAILAEGADAAAVFAWIAAHEGHPEAAAPVAPGRGLHSARLRGSMGAGASTPRRYVLPPGALIDRSPQASGAAT